MLIPGGKMRYLGLFLLVLIYLIKDAHSISSLQEHQLKLEQKLAFKILQKLETQNKQEILSETNLQLQYIDHSFHRELKEFVNALVNAKHPISLTKTSKEDFRQKQELKIFKFSNKKNPKKMRREYDNLQQVINELVSEEPGAKFVSTSQTRFRVAEVQGEESEFSARIEAEFMGVELNLGPILTFKSDFSTVATIAQEGIAPLFNANGVFDPVRRDAKGHAILKDGKIQYKVVFFTCDAKQRFRTEVEAQAGLRIMGPGYTHGWSKQYQNETLLISRRITVPSYVGGKQFTLHRLSKLCHHYFLNATAPNGRTIKENVHEMSLNLIKALRYTSPAIKCAKDYQCYDWYNNEVIRWHKSRTTPRCIIENQQMGHANCRLRGTKGANCTVRIDGQRVSSGSFEYQCDRGLTCRTTHEGGWFQNWELYDYYKGECLP